MRTRWIALTLALCTTQTALARDEGWRAGLARVVVTPDEPVWMSGYAHRRRPAESTRHDLWAKALAIEDAGGERALLVTLDLIGLDAQTSRRMREGVMARTGLRAESIALASSHTHTGPVVGHNLAPMYELDEAAAAAVARFTDRLIEAVIEVGVSAVADLGPATVAHGKGRADFAVNRRDNPEARVAELRAAGTLRGPVDHDVPVLVVRKEGRLRALVFGYACHATVLQDFSYSGDYPGFAQLALERKWPGVQAMFWAGCGADQNPLPRRTVELAEAYGARLAASVAAVVDGGVEALDASLHCEGEVVELSFAELPSRAELEETVRSGPRYEASRARHLLEQLEATGALSPTYPVPVQLWRLGELRWCFLGGEVVVDYALRLKDELGPRTWVTAYANDVMAYVPSERVLTEGGYEGAGAMVYYGLPSAWAPGLELRVVAALRRMAGLEAGASFQISTFAVDATPPLGSPLCDGLVPPASRVDDPLELRGVVLHPSGQPPIVLCAVDWVGIGNGGQDAFRRALAEATGTVVDRVAVHTLHQHDAPGCDFDAEAILSEHELGGQMFDPGFARDTIRRAAEAAARAPRRTVTQVGIASAKVERVASNRRLLGPDGKVERVRWSKSRDPEAIAAPEGVIDPELTLWSLWDGERPRLAVTYYATHPQSHYGQGAVSADFVGLARRSFARERPGTFALHFDGASGNVAAGKYNDGEPARRAELAGRLVDGMRRAWGAVERHALAGLSPRWTVVPVVLPRRDLLADEARMLRAIEDRGLAMRERIRAARDLAFARRVGTPVELSALRLGPLCLVHLPGELFVEYQLEARALVSDALVCVAAYGDYGPGYIGTEVAYEQGGYETGPVSRVGPSVEEVLRRGIRELLEESR